MGFGQLFQKNRSKLSTESNGFKRHGENEYQSKFSQSEREVLINLSEQIIELLAERTDQNHDDPLAAMIGITSHDSPPEDEVLLRLLPNAYADETAASEFRRYTESTLLDKKRAHAMALRSNLINAGNLAIDLDHDGAMAWLGALNDIRLALGVRLNIQENIQNSAKENLELLKPDDPHRAVYAVYAWLGHLQESLVQALMDDVTER